MQLSLSADIASITNLTVTIYRGNKKSKKSTNLRMLASWYEQRNEAWQEKEPCALSNTLTEFHNQPQTPSINLKMTFKITVYSYKDRHFPKQAPDYQICQSKASQFLQNRSLSLTICLLTICKLLTWGKYNQRRKILVTTKEAHLCLRPDEIHRTPRNRNTTQTWHRTQWNCDKRSPLQKTTQHGLKIGFWQGVGFHGNMKSFFKSFFYKCS